ncbi:MAG TPA: hypothetical protein DCR14_14155 [Acidimicrobiaceae bacterium]|nr:hypothetical protein [Acidimicrobiaceae bacterium]
MIKRTLLAGLAALTALAGVAGVAHAYPPPTSTPGTTVITDSSVYRPRSTVTITANGFAACAGQLVTFVITIPAVTTPATMAPTTTVANSSGLLSSGLSLSARAATAPAGLQPGDTIVVTAIADANGVAVVTITAPNFLGTYTVSASSPNCPTATTTFTVRNLPAAGSEVAPWLWSAGAALAVGFGFLLVARRRRSQHSAAHA